jgi:acyl-CoA thioesterase FadM
VDAGGGRSSFRISWGHGVYAGGGSYLGGAFVQSACTSHKVEYLSPAFAGDRIEVRTWVANRRRVRSLRRYEFFRKSDGKLLVKGETEWVFVDAQTGSPRAIPEAIVKIFQPLLDE